MVPGPTYIKKCPGCEKPLKFPTIASGNTADATYWTDGKYEAPMLPDTPLLRKSPSEGTLFWEEECQELGRVWDRKEWENLEVVANPAEEDYARAIRLGMASSTEKEIYLRTRYWWSGNDRRRRADIPPAWEESHVENLKRLATLYSDDQADGRIMKAEIMRELALFDQAVALLDWNFSEEYSVAVERIKNLARQKVSRVMKYE